VTLPTTLRVGLADKTGKILKLSGNLNALANLPAGACPLPFTGPYDILADDGYFLCIVINGTYGTTVPTPMRAGALNLALAAFGSSAPPAFTWTGQTDLPALGASLTLSAQPGLAYYMAAY